MYCLNRIVLTSRFAIAGAIRRARSTDVAVKKSVFISQSTDIFTNLALEDWFYKNMNFAHHQVLMLWRNDPCVVIGRHQNPWEEANVELLKQNGVRLSRRNSGGGTVYHDLGNLNLTFFTSRDKYNRKYNLELISRALFREWGLKSDISPRQDLVVRGNYKVSGTAAKLGRENAYHHCTLLVDVDKGILKEALVKENLGIVSNATKSVPSRIANLREVNHHITVEKLMAAVGWEWLRTSPDELSDSGLNFASKQNGFKYINPTDGWYPDLNKMRDELSSWQWIYGKTPKFKVNIEVPLVNPKDDNNLELTMQIEEGHVEEIYLNIPVGMSSLGFHGHARVLSDLKGRRFDKHAVVALKNLLPENCVDNKKEMKVCYGTV